MKNKNINEALKLIDTLAEDGFNQTGKSIEHFPAISFLIEIIEEELKK